MEKGRLDSSGNETFYLIFTKKVHYVLNYSEYQCLLMKNFIY